MRLSPGAVARSGPTSHRSWLARAPLALCALALAAVGLPGCSASGQPASDHVASPAVVASSRQVTNAAMPAVFVENQGQFADAVRFASFGGALSVDFLDDEAVTAFRDAQPFPNPPPGLVDPDSKLITFRFGFYFEISGAPTFRVFRQ